MLLHIDDDGPGISDDQVEYVFDAFTTSGDDTTLTKHIGLGLYIAKSLVELHQGNITISTSPNHGARFTVSIPC